jgi:hypothetical protein
MARVAGPLGHSKVDIAVLKFGYDLAQRMRIARRIVKLENNILSFNISLRAQPFAKTIKERIRLGLGGDPKDPIEPCRLLRPHDQGPCHRTTNKCNEISPSHLSHTV